MFDGANVHKFLGTTKILLTTKKNVSLHVNNILREDEITENSRVTDKFTTEREGKRKKKQV